MSQLVPSLMGSVTISALLNDDYYDEKKKRKEGGRRSQFVPGTNWWALIVTSANECPLAAPRALVGLVCSGTSETDISGALFLVWVGALDSRSMRTRTHIIAMCSTVTYIKCDSRLPIRTSSHEIE